MKNLINIIVGFTVALVIVIFTYLLSNTLYHTKEIAKRGYKVDTSAEQETKITAIKDLNGITAGDLPDLTAEKEVDIAQMIKNADINKGARIFKKCMACHTAVKGAGNKTGPNLFGVVGRKRASIADFSYSDAMKNKGGTWDYESINQFITSPRDYVKGTKMAFAGLKKAEDRANVIAYLEANAKQ